MTEQSRSKDPLGDLLKQVEAEAAPPPIQGDRVIYARMDGRGFSKFTKGMIKPFDHRMTRVMQKTTEVLLAKTHAKLAYVQSDEISLVLLPSEDGQHFFGGRPQKLISVLASLTTAAFHQAMSEEDPVFSERLRDLPHFDARVHGVLPENVSMQIIWRGSDAKRNAISMIAQSLFTHQELQGVSTNDLVKLIESAGHNLSNYPAASLHGTLMFPRPVKRELSPEELARIPEKVRPQPGQTFERTEVVTYSNHAPCDINNTSGLIFKNEMPSRQHVLRV